MTRRTLASILMATSLSARVAAEPRPFTVGIFPNDVHLARPDRSNTYQDIVFLSQIGQTLVEQNHVAEIIPGIAKSWRISPDRKIYRFELRKDIRFHDGSALRARDVVYSLNRAIYAQDNAAHYFLDVITGFEEGKAARRCPGIKAVDEHTVEIRLERPYSPLLFALSSAAMVIGRTPSPGSSDGFIGSGPYRVEKYGGVTTLKAYAGYVGPYSPRIQEFRLVTDTPAMIGKRRLDAEELPDFFFIYLEDTFGPLPKEAYRFVKRPGMIVSGFWINQRAEGLRYKGRRRELARILAHTSKGIRSTVSGIPLEDVFPTGMLGHAPRSKAYTELFSLDGDPRVLRKKPLRIGLFAPIPGGNDPFAERLKKSTGLDVTFVQLGHEGLLDDLRKTDVDAVFLIWKSVFLDPEPNLTPFDFIQAFEQSASRHEFTRLRKEGTQAVLGSKRSKIYARISSMIFEEGLFVPILQLDEIQALKRDLRFSGAIYRYSPMLSELETEARHDR